LNRSVLEIKTYDRKITNGIEFSVKNTLRITDSNPSVLQKVLNCHIVLSRDTKRWGSPKRTHKIILKFVHSWNQLLGFSFFCHPYPSLLLSSSSCSALNDKNIRIFRFKWIATQFSSGAFQFFSVKTHRVFSLLFTQQDK